MSVGAEWDTKRSRKSEIRKLQVALTIDQKVLGLEIAMQDAVAMAVAHALDQLRHEFLDHGISQTESAHVHIRAIWQCLAATAFAHGESFHVLFEIEVEELADEVQLVAVGVDNV